MSDPNDFPEEGDETVEIIACQGPPSCSLQGDDAIEAAMAGCPFCRRETWHRGELIGVREPGRA